LARNSWLTGTASWTYQAGLKYILGVRPEYDGLRIDPCIPVIWEGFNVKRRFRGADYQINVTNPKRVCRGVVSILLDGEALQGTLIPAFGDGALHSVDVIMG
jgi:cellobiose phosphorylase